MAQCVAIDTNGFVVASAASAPCATYVLSTEAEWQVATTNPFNLSISDGTALAALIASVWVSAFCARALVRVLGDRDDEGV